MSKTIEELLELVKNRESTGKKAPSENQSTLQFIEDLGIEPGTQAVPNFLIFYVYRQVWNTSYPKTKAKKITFFQTFGKHLPSYRHGNQRFYMIKEGIFDVSDEVIKTAEIYDRQYWNKKEVREEIPSRVEARGKDET